MTPRVSPAQRVACRDAVARPSNARSGWIPAGAAMTAVLLACTAAHAADAADDGEWRMAGKDYANPRNSAHDHIKAGNVASLKLAFTFSTGVTRGHEAAPIVAGNTMYIVTPFPNYLYALDLTRPGAPTKWKFEPNPN